jgi:hypothetical protein
LNANDLSARVAALGAPGHAAPTSPVRVFRDRRGAGRDPCGRFQAPSPFSSLAKVASAES